MEIRFRRLDDPDFKTAHFTDVTPELHDELVESISDVGVYCTDTDSYLSVLATNLVLDGEEAYVELVLGDE